MDGSGLVIEACEIEEEDLSLAKWLSPVTVPGEEARKVQELIAATLAEVARLVVKELGENTVLLKRRIVVVAKKG